MNFPGHPMFPSAPTFPGVLQEFAHPVPLTWSPEEIHPKTIPVVIKREQFLPYWRDCSQLKGDRTRHNHVRRRIIHHHKMAGNRPSDPGVVKVVRLEMLMEMTMFPDQFIDPIERTG